MSKLRGLVGEVTEIVQDDDGYIVEVYTSVKSLEAVRKLFPGVRILTRRPRYIELLPPDVKPDKKERKR